MTHGIAIVGLSGAYPGAETLDRFYDRLLRGGPSMGPGTLSPCDLDVQAFGIPPIHRRAIPELLLRSLCSVSEALAHSALEMDQLPKERVDVVFGTCFASANGSRNEVGLQARGLMQALEDSPGGVASSPEYKAWLGKAGALFREACPTSFNDKLYDQAASIPSHISLRHGFKGRSLALESGAMTSFMALKTATDHLVEGSCQMAVVTCAQRWDNPAIRDALSHLDDAPYGVPGEGVGTVILMGLEEAVKQKATVHALIRSVTLRRGGAGPKGRCAKVAAMALEEADSPATSVDFIEMSGPQQEEKGFCDLFSGGVPWLGRGEETTGHTYANMGMVGVTKASLMLSHRRFFPRPGRAASGAGSLTEIPLRGLVLGSACGGASGAVLLEAYRPDSRSLLTRPRGQRRPDPIAVVGAGACFPGAPSLERFWDTLRRGTSTLEPVTERVLPRGLFYAPGVYDPWRSCTEIASSMAVPIPGAGPWPLSDRAQRTALAVAGEALESFGAPHPLPGRASVFLGSNLVLEQERRAGAHHLMAGLGQRLFSSETRKVLSRGAFEMAQALFEGCVDRLAVGEANASPEALLPSAMCGQLAREYGFQGEAAAVHGACASSLAALDMACTSLRNGSSDLAVAGGVEFGASCYDLVLCSRMHLLSPSRIAPFDAAADGFSLGDGCSMVVLRRLADAERNGEPILAVIRGVGRSSDSNSMMAPDANGQALAIRRAFEGLPFGMHSVDYLEMHGTGTSRGDVVESLAVSRTYGASGRQRPLYLGSVKAAVGHTLAAAGGAGLMRAIFALREQVFPKALNISTPNPKLEFGEMNAVFPGENTPWLRPGPDPRRAAVSSFGTGGVNYHVILEEYKGERDGF